MICKESTRCIMWAYEDFVFSGNFRMHNNATLVICKFHVCILFSSFLENSIACTMIEMCLPVPYFLSIFLVMSSNFLHLFCAVIRNAFEVKNMLLKVAYQS